MSEEENEVTNEPDEFMGMKKVKAIVPNDSDKMTASQTFKNDEGEKIKIIYGISAEQVKEWDESIKKLNRLIFRQNIESLLTIFLIVGIFASLVIFYPRIINVLTLLYERLG